MAQRALIAFVREPNPETCKTRLAPVLSPEERVAFYCAMLDDLAETMEQVPCDRRVFCYAPGRGRGDACVAPTGIERQVQIGDDLGERMLNALVGAGFKPAPTHERGRMGRGNPAPTSTVIIGSDIPLLSAKDIESAYTLLENRHLVLAPTFDGGYCLIGARSDAVEDLPTLFDGMTWSHPRVFAETLRRIRRIQERNPAFSFGILPMRYDVDTPEDFALLTVHLDALALAGEPVPRHTVAFLAGRHK